MHNIQIYTTKCDVLKGRLELDRACNPSTWDAKPKDCCEFKVSQGHRVRPCLNKQVNKNFQRAQVMKLLVKVSDSFSGLLLL